MSPIIMQPSQIKILFQELISKNLIAVFSKTTCPFCFKVKELFRGLHAEIKVFELDQYPADQTSQMQDVLQEMTGQRTVPNVFIRQRHIGGCTDTQKALADKTLYEMIEGTYEKRDFDFVVIGGGSGGLASAKEAASLGKSVAICDFVTPSPCGTTWGLGGTCVNVGCIPKKLMHKAADLKHDMDGASLFGWSPTIPAHDWSVMISNIQNYIRSLNQTYEEGLVNAKVTYINAYAKFRDSHTIELFNKDGVLVRSVSGQNFLLAMGGRPLYPEIPGAKEFCITSDDLFSLQDHPGKTLVIGASYVALESAGFLAGLGIDVTVMVRSVILRGFDEEISNMIASNMEENGVRFMRNTVPISVERISDAELKVVMLDGLTNNIFEETFKTVMLAIGRKPCTEGIGLDGIGVSILDKDKRIVVNEEHQSTVRNIFAVGDIVEPIYQLTPVAIHAGRLVAKRLFTLKPIPFDHNCIPTTVFTPMEYGCVGLTEEDAYTTYSKENIEVYHGHFQPLEWELPNRCRNKSFVKLVCLKTEEERVVGFHYLGPNAGEVTQGFALALKLGAKKEDFNNLIGIHPTCAEVFVNIAITKASGKSAKPGGGC